MIEVKNLVKMYGDRAAVDSISFSVHKGEVLGFLGQNGAGKTTTMKILTCFMAPTAGTASVAGFDTFSHPLEVKKRIGYLPETPPIHLELTVYEYLSYVCDLKKVPRASKQKKINTALEHCQLGSVRKRLIGNLSKGFRQRVGLAQALIHDPEVLILDEPTVGLDPRQVSEVRNLIKSMKGTRTIVYSSHILSEVAATCSRIIIIDKGKIVAQESINELGAAGEVAKVEVVFETNYDAVKSAIEKLDGVHNVIVVEPEMSISKKNKLIVELEPKDEYISKIASKVVELNAGLLRLSPVQLALEEYYLNLIGVRGNAA